MKDEGTKYISKLSNQCKHLAHMKHAPWTKHFLISCRNICRKKVIRTWNMPVRILLRLNPFGYLRKMNVLVKMQCGSGFNVTNAWRFVEWDVKKYDFYTQRCGLIFVVSMKRRLKFRLGICWLKSCWLCWRLCWCCVNCSQNRTSNSFWTNAHFISQCP